MAWHLAGTIIISFLVLARIYHIPYINPDYNSPLIYWWGYCNLSIPQGNFNIFDFFKGITTKKGNSSKKSVKVVNTLVMVCVMRHLFLMQGAWIWRWCICSFQQFCVLYEFCRSRFLPTEGCWKCTWSSVWKESCSQIRRWRISCKGNIIRPHRMK